MDKDRNPYTFLVIEDNLGDYMLIQDYLEEQFIIPTLVRATSYKQAKEQLEQDEVNINLIFLDLSLPDKNGIDLVKDVMQISYGRPVIVLTGYSDISFAITSLSLGVSDYLLKDDITSPMLYKSIIYNIERNKSLTNLHESEKRYSDLFHLSPQPMWVYDLETYRFLDVNKSAEMHYGYDYEEFLNLTIKDIRVNCAGTKPESLLYSSKKDSLMFFEGEFLHKKKCGAVIDVEIRSNIISFKNRKAALIWPTI